MLKYILNIKLFFLIQNSVYDNNIKLKTECDVFRRSRGLDRPLWPTLCYANSIVL